MPNFANAISANDLYPSVGDDAIDEFLLERDLNEEDGIDEDDDDPDDEDLEDLEDDDTDEDDEDEL